MKLVTDASQFCSEKLPIYIIYIHVYIYICLARVHGEGFHSSKIILSRTVVLPRCKLQMIPGIQIDHLEVLGLSHHCRSKLSRRNANRSTFLWG